MRQRREQGYSTGNVSEVHRMVQMEKPVSHCDMELVKMAMLRHEETFRQQVHELHRLYRVQKQLMGGLSKPPELSCRRHIRRRQPRRRRALDLHLHLPADGKYIVITPPSTEDGLELTLAIGGGGGGGGASRRRRRDESTGGATGTPLGSSDICISGGSLTTSSSMDTSASPLYQRAMPAFRLQEATTVGKQQPPRTPWLVQCLSLKMA